jgi:hypothetical protein
MVKAAACEETAMDFIPFEKVSVKDAKEVLDGPAKEKDRLPDWSNTRSPQMESLSADLTEQAWQWLDALPPEIQPGGLVQQFPRIANRLAELWSKPVQCHRYMEEMMLDNRGNRKGFPLGVTLELAKLKAFYQESRGMVQKFDAWGQPIKGA